MAAAARFAKSLVFAVLLCTGAARAERLPMQSDVDRCAKRATDMGDNSMQGKVRIQLLLRKTGQVYAAYIHTSSVGNKVLEHCLTNQALLWQYEAQAVDTTAPYPLSVVSGGSEAGGMTGSVSVHQGAAPPSVMMPSARPVVEPTELEEARAQDTLEILENATAAEQGQALLAVHKYAEAVVQFRAALGRNPSDAIALRGLSQALVETRGDLAEARNLAERLGSAAVGSVVGPEAMLRACAAQKDDLCVFKSWKEATGNKLDLAPRSRIIRELQPLAQAAAERLNAAAHARAEGNPPVAAPAPPAAFASAEVAAAPATSSAVPGATPARAVAAPEVSNDPCATEPGDEKQALCVVKRCLDEGSVLYAQELSAQNGVQYVAGEWRTKAVGAGKLLVTRPIAPKTADPAAVAPAARHDAIWLVKLGAQFSIAPSTSEARQITLTHNACGKQR